MNRTYHHSFFVALVCHLVSTPFQSRFVSGVPIDTTLPEGCEHCDGLVPLFNGWPDLFSLKGNAASTSSPYQYAGKTLCIPAGNYWSLGIRDVWGLPGQPVTITNCGGGTASFDGQKPHPHNGSPRATTPVSIRNCTHLHLTGLSDPTLGTNGGETMGIIAENSPPYTHGVHVYGGSSHIEIDHIVSRNHGYGGIVIRTYPECGGKYSRNVFEQRNTSVHNTIVSNVGGEGMYIGTSHYHVDEGGYVYGSSSTCPGETAAEASLKGVYVYNNTLRDIGMDAIQIGAAVESVSVHHNTIEHFATLNKYGHSHGIAMNPGTTGNVYNNRIKGPLDGGTTEPVTAIAYYGQANSNQHSAIYNNIIHNVDQAFVFYNREDAENQSYDFSFNTVYNFTSRSPTKIYCLGTVDPTTQPPVNVRIRNNIFALGPEAVVLDNPNSSNGWSGWKKFYGNTNGVPGHPSMECLDYMETQNGNAWALETDFEATTPVQFVDALNEDFRIENHLPSSNGASNWYPETDFDGASRFDSPDQGAFESAMK